MPPKGRSDMTLDVRDESPPASWVTSRQIGKRVDPGELLEQQGLALHHRHRRRGADVAEAEHRGAVGDDRHGVLADRVLVRKRLVLLDRRAHARDAGGVRHRQVVGIADRTQREHLDLATLVHAEGPVPPVVQGDPVDRGGDLGDALCVLFVAAVHHHVFDDRRPLRLEPADLGDVATGITDCRRQVTEYPRRVGEGHVQRDRVRRGGGIAR